MPRAKSVCISLRTSIEICRPREGIHLYPLECRLSVGSISCEDDENFVDYKLEHLDDVFLSVLGIRIEVFLHKIGFLAP